LKKNMKTTYLLATLIAATFPLTTVLAEDSAKSEKAAQNEDQQPAAAQVEGIEMGQTNSDTENQEAELDKLVVAMNNASADKKLDAVAAVLTKLVEQRKAMHEQMSKTISANDQEGMGMCRKLGCDADGKHSTHH